MKPTQPRQPAPNRRPRVLFTLIILFIFVGLSSQCTPQEAANPTAPAPTATPTLTPAPTNTPEPSPTPTPAPLSPNQIFSQISPSVAFIDTTAGTGSGFLIQDGYLVTNAHVVWPFDKVRVAFPDGTEFKDAPLLGWDLMADIAVIGPLETDLPPLTPGDGEKSVIGSDVYLIGYPGEVEEFPQPSISRGLISRLREWERESITYFQSDAAIAGGQSGGVLVSEFGQVIGISGFAFANHEFGIIASTADIMPRVQRIISGENTDGLQRHPFTKKEGGSTEVPIKLEHVLQSKILTFWPEEGEKITIELKGADSQIFWIRDAARAMVTLDPQTKVPFTRKTEFYAGASIPHFIVVLDNWGRWSEGTLISSIPVTEYNDPDESRPMRLMGRTVRGCLDIPGDIDTFPIELKKGQSIHVRTESVMVNPLLTIERADVYSQEKLALDDDTGGGIFGTDAELSFTAPEDARYIIVVREAANWNIGGYYLTVEPYAEGVPTPIVPTPLPPVVQTDAGEMRTYVSPFKPKFSIQYPAQWRIKTDSSLCSASDVVCLGNRLNSMAFIVLSERPAPPSLTLDVLAEEITSSIPEAEKNTERKQFTTANGQEFLVLHIPSFQGVLQTWLAITIYEKTPLFIIFTMVDADAYQTYKEPEGLVTPANIDDAFPGGTKAFEEMVMHVLESFGKPK